MTLKNGKVKHKKSKRTFEASIKALCRKREGETLLKWFFIFKQIEKYQNQYYPYNLNLTRFCRRTSLHVLMFHHFSTKKVCEHIENDNLWRKDLAVSHDVKRNRDLFSL